MKVWNRWNFLPGKGKYLEIGEFLITDIKKKKWKIKKLIIVKLIPYAQSIYVNMFS